MFDSSLQLRVESVHSSKDLGSSWIVICDLHCGYHYLIVIHNCTLSLSECWRWNWIISLANWVPLSFLRIVDFKLSTPWWRMLWALFSEPSPIVSPGCHEYLVMYISLGGLMNYMTPLVLRKELCDTLKPIMCRRTLCMSLLRLSLLYMKLSGHCVSPLSVVFLSLHVQMMWGKLWYTLS
jgi:hypothetical protein